VDWTDFEFRPNRTFLHAAAFGNFGLKAVVRGGLHQGLLCRQSPAIGFIGPEPSVSLIRYCFLVTALGEGL
jgi:hypothetical protein